MVNKKKEKKIENAESSQTNTRDQDWAQLLQVERFENRFNNYPGKIINYATMEAQTLNEVTIASQLISQLCDGSNSRERSSESDLIFRLCLCRWVVQSSVWQEKLKVPVVYFKYGRANNHVHFKLLF